MKIGERIKNFICKLFSLKILIWFPVTTILLIFKIVTEQTWIIVGITIFVSRLAEKIVLPLVNKKSEE